jgi:hypothetical protein
MVAVPQRQFAVIAPATATDARPTALVGMCLFVCLFVDEAQLGQRPLYKAPASATRRRPCWLVSHCLLLVPSLCRLFDSLTSVCVPVGPSLR